MNLVRAMAKGLRASNHYVPQSLLRRWAEKDGKLWTYRTLVSRESVPAWRRQSTKSVARLTHLYTRRLATGHTDELERWFDEEFEAPAAEALNKVVAEERLTASDWERLVRLLACQDVRTPTALIRRISDWEKRLPGLLRDAVERTKSDLEQGIAEPRKLSGRTFPSLPMPLKIQKFIQPEDAEGELRATITTGRQLWHWEIRYQLTNTVRVLARVNWTILRPVAGRAWLTSDTPVVKPRFISPESYSFSGGWGSPTTWLMMPLDPQHLLFGSTSGRPPRKWTELSGAETEMLQRMIAQNSHQLIFAVDRTDEVSTFRPRSVDAERLEREATRWSAWDQEHSVAELDHLAP